jgi:hypothetical protein
VARVVWWRTVVWLEYVVVVVVIRYYGYLRDGPLAEFDKSGSVW